MVVQILCKWSTNDWPNLRLKRESEFLKLHEPQGNGCRNWSLVTKERTKCNTTGKKQSMKSFLMIFCYSLRLVTGLLIIRELLIEAYTETHSQTLWCSQEIPRKRRRKDCSRSQRVHDMDHVECFNRTSVWATQFM